MLAIIPVMSDGSRDVYGDHKVVIIVTADAVIMGDTENRWQ